MIKKIITAVVIGGVCFIPFAKASENKPTAQKSFSSMNAFVGGSNAPQISMSYVNTGYGLLGCLQKSESRAYQIGANNVTRTNNSVIATYGGTEKILIWCRGPEAIVTVAGNNPIPIRDDFVNYL